MSVRAVVRLERGTRRMAALAMLVALLVAPVQAATPCAHEAAGPAEATAAAHDHHAQHEAPAPDAPVPGDDGCATPLHMSASCAVSVSLPATAALLQAAPSQAVAASARVVDGALVLLATDLFHPPR